ncbi:hypothetical protein KJ966_29560 [bacterium]|nr:hypothetical protein [bacterium]
MINNMYSMFFDELTKIVDKASLVFGILIQNLLQSINLFLEGLLHIKDYIQADLSGMRTCFYLFQIITTLNNFSLDF